MRRFWTLTALILFLLSMSLALAYGSPTDSVGVGAPVLQDATATPTDTPTSTDTPTATPTPTNTSTPTSTNTPTNTTPPTPNFLVTLSHVGTAANNDFLTNSSTGTVSITIINNGAIPTAGLITVTIDLNGGLTYIAPDSNPNFDCTAGLFVVCTTMMSIPPTGPDATQTITFNVQAPSSPQGTTTNQAEVSGGGAPTVIVSDLDPFLVVAPSPTPSITNTPTQTRTPTPTRTPTGITLTFPVATFTPTTNPALVTPTLPTPTLSPTFIQPPPTRTPLPRPANAGLAVPIPRTGARVVTNRDDVNVRLVPAIGAEVIGTVDAGFAADVEARSADNQWVRIDFAGEQGWIGFPVISLIEGDLNNVPIGDPRTIPYGGWENPRAGITTVTSPYTGRLANSGLRVRGGPSRGYPVLANAPRYTVFSLLGRTAANNWVQVNFEGTLGWVASQFVEFQQGLGTLDALPIGGIVADAVPVSDPTTDAYGDTLSLMLARVNIAQESLDAMRAIWTQIALGNRVQCGNYPARPSDYNIPLPVLSAFSASLTPLQADFNAAMGHIRAAIDAFIDICSRPQPPEGYVGQAVVTQALDALNAADGLLASLRGTLTPLVLDVNRVPSEDECRFTYNGQSEIVPRLRIGQVRTATLSAQRYVRGFCFDASVGQSLRLEMIRARGNIHPRAAIAPFTSPTNFIGTVQINESGGLATIAPIIITATGQYIVIVSDLEWSSRTEPINGEFAILLTDITGGGGSGQTLAVDAQGNVIVSTPTLPGFTPGVSAVCPSIQYTCAQIGTCDQARACYAAGNTSLDTNANGKPCDEYQGAVCFGQP